MAAGLSNLVMEMEDAVGPFGDCRMPLPIGLCLDLYES